MLLSSSSTNTLIPATPNTPSHTPSSSSSAAILVLQSPQDIISLLCAILKCETLSEEGLSQVRALINVINDITQIKQQEAAIYEKNRELHPKIKIEIPKSVPFNINFQNEAGNTALVYAAYNGHPEAVSLLIEAKANVDTPGKDGYTALIWAALQGHPEVVHLLIEAKANVDAPDKNGVTALARAALQGHPKVVHLLIEAKANVDTPDKDGRTALILAAYQGHPEIVRLLIEAKANVDTPGKDGYTALIWAALKGHPGVVSLLIEAKANVDAPDKDGATAPAYAAYNGHLEVARLLIEAKANVDTPDKNNCTALSWAVLKGHFKIAHQFINAGAKLEIINNVGETALDGAIARSNLAIISLLLAHGAQIRNIEALWTCLCSCDPREPDFLIPLQKLCEHLENYLATTLSMSGDASSEIRKTEKLRNLLKEATGYLEKLETLSSIEQSKLNARVRAATSDMPSELVSLISAYEPPLMRLNVFRLQDIDRVLLPTIEESKPIPTSFFIQEKTTRQRRATLAGNLKQFRSREGLITLLKDYQTMRGIQSDSFFKGNKDRKLAAVANAIANIENNAPLDPSYTKERNQGMLGAICRPGRSF